MQDPLPVQPFSKPVDAKVRVPGSKSITNRALILAALADGDTTLDGCLFSRDTKLMVQALKDLGFQINADEAAKTIRVSGQAGRIPANKAQIDIGNSGTSARFLTAFLSTRQGGEYILDGDAAMRKRPIQKLADTLNALGCQIDTASGFFPIRIRPQGLQGGKALIDASESSQFVSALLMAAPLARGDLQIELSNTSIRRGYIDLTLKVMESFGIPADKLQSSETGYAVASSGGYKSALHSYQIEADASAASYFFALPIAVGGQIEIEGVSKTSMQSDIEFANAAQRAGALIEWGPHSATCRFDPSQNTPKALRENFYAFSDTFLTAAALAPYLSGNTFIDGIAHTRHQECDRIEAMKQGLSRAGQRVTDQEGSLEIAPQTLTPATIETYEDHRVAMSFAILGSRDVFKNQKPWIKIIDPLCVAKTFPNYFDVLENLRK